MLEKIIATLDELYDVVWFRNVGVHDTQIAEVLSSWEAAVEHCGSSEWESRRLSGFAEYGRHILRASPDRWEKWADTSGKVVPLVRALVGEKTKDVVAQYNLPEVFTDSVMRDIHYLCMEAELADVYPPGFFAHLAYWYWAGHFPCGWNYHPLPAGHSLVIY